jgi:hypothetical protein
MRGSGRRNQVRIPVAVLAFFLQIATFEGVKMAFGGRIGGRLQKNDVAPARLERAWLGPISAAAETVWRRWQDQAMREFSACESAFDRGRALKLVTA